MDYIQEEINLAKKFFDLNEIIEFQLAHDVQIIRAADYNYICYIDGSGYSPSLTTIGALTLGIKQFKQRQMDFKQRLEIEQKELEDKMSSLYQFLETEEFTKVNSVQQVLMNSQIKAMETYNTILLERLKRL